MNDNGPRFSQKLIETSILQSIKPDEKILNLEAIDLDLTRKLRDTSYVIKSVYSRITLPQYNEELKKN